MLPILSRTIGSEFMDWQFYLLFFPIVFLYGICIGSFLNVLIYRLPNNESLIKRSSHCMTCQAKIRKRDLIPVFSWLFLRGKCHNCGARISPQYPIVEALNGILYIVALLVLDLNANGIICCLFFSLLIVVGFMDWNTLEIDLRRDQRCGHQATHRRESPGHRAGRYPADGCQRTSGWPQGDCGGCTDRHFSCCGLRPCL